MPSFEPEMLPGSMARRFWFPQSLLSGYSAFAGRRQEDQIMINTHYLCSRVVGIVILHHSWTTALRGLILRLVNNITTSL